MIVRAVNAAMQNARRRLCKPLADRLEKEVASHPTLRRLILPIGRVRYRIQAQLQRRIDAKDGVPPPGEIPPPSDKEAIQSFAEGFGELCGYAEEHAASSPTDKESSSMISSVS